MPGAGLSGMRGAGRSPDWAGWEKPGVPVLIWAMATRPLLLPAPPSWKGLLEPGAVSAKGLLPETHTVS